MKPAHRLVFLAAALLSMLSLTACSLSLASDVTPPPDYKPTQPVTPSAIQVVYPLVPPDPAQGQVLFAQKCLPCHGATGKGDGPQAANLPNPPPSIGSPELSRASHPVDWFTIVSQGNLQKMMPGFSGSLSDRQRWDVVSYVYTLSMTKEELQQGKTLYTDQCQGCHGPTGKGDGPQAASLSGTMHNWTSPELLAKTSAQEIHDLVLAGTAKGMPAYQGKLDDGQVWAVSSYVRSLEFASAPAPAEQAQAGTPQTAATSAPAAGSPQPSQAAGTPQSTAEAGTVTINGTVINASGGDLPAGTKVDLLAFDAMTQALTLTGDVQPDGSFSFDRIETNPQRVFMVTVKYNEHTFNSDILKATDIAAGQPGTIVLHVYDTSTDTSTLVADRMHVFFDMTKPGMVQVGELFIITNPTNKLIVAKNSGEAVLKFDLPKGYTNLSFQDGAIGDRYLQTDTGFGDTMAIQPGQGGHQVLFAYDLPYQGKANVNLSSPLPVTAAVIIAPSSGVRVQGSQLQDGGEQTMQNLTVHMYSASSLAAGENLAMTLSGSPGQSSLLDLGSQTNLMIGLAALLVVIALVVYWFLMRRRALALEMAGGTEPLRTESPESLLDAIVALDDLYQSGQIPREAYEERRAELKEKLRVARGGAKGS